MTIKMDLFGLLLLLYICRLHVNSAFTQSDCESITTTADFLTPYWWHGSQSCFQEIMSPGLNFEAAAMYCRDTAPKPVGSRGRLAILNTVSLIQYLMPLFEGDGWFGLKETTVGTSMCHYHWYDIASNGTETHAAKCLDQYGGFQGYPASTMNDFVSDNGDASKFCVRHENGKLGKLELCSNAKKFMCEYVQAEEPVETAPADCAPCCVEPFPCKNSGACTVTGGTSYECDCAPTFTSPDCSTCESPLCGNNCTNLDLGISNSMGGFYWPYNEAYTSCFYRISNGGYDYDAGMAACEANAPPGTRGRLAIVNDRVLINYLLSSLDGTHTFLALRTLDTSDPTDPGNWNWFDGSDLTISSCIDAMPIGGVDGMDGGDTSKLCVKIDNPVWKVESCTAENAPLCEFIPNDIAAGLRVGNETINITSCESGCTWNLCKNGATCTDISPTPLYTCTCPIPYYGANCQYYCDNSTWSTWSSCSKTAGYGYQMRYRNALPYDGSNPSNPCPNDPVIKEYQSCYIAEVLDAVDPRPASVCASKSGMYLKPACYFIATSASNISWDEAHGLCSANGGRLASVYDSWTTLWDIMLLLLTQEDATPHWMSLKANAASNTANWMDSSGAVDLPFLSQYGVPISSTEECLAPRTQKTKIVPLAMLNQAHYVDPQTIDCTDTGSVSKAVCMIDQWSARFNAQNGIRATPSGISPAAVSTSAENNWMCGLLCQRMVKCLGFNYKQSDGTCELLSNKGSMPTSAQYWSNAPSVTYTTTADAQWKFYSRVD